MSNNVVYREAVTQLVKEMRGIIHEALLSHNVDESVAFRIAQAVEDTGMCAYREGFREGQRNAHH